MISCKYAMDKKRLPMEERFLCFLDSRLEPPAQGTLQTGNDLARSGSIPEQYFRSSRRSNTPTQAIGLGQATYHPFLAGGYSLDRIAHPGSALG